MFYISYFSLSLVFIICILCFKPFEKQVEWVLCVFGFMCIAITNQLGILNDIWPPFHFGDESYFYDTAIDIKKELEQGKGFIDALLNTTWNYKYYGFIAFDFISVYGANGSEISDKFSIVLSLSSIYLIFIRHVYCSKSMGLYQIRLVLIPVFLYMSILNYRDGFVGILLFIIFKAVYERKVITLVIVSMFLILFRVEFIPLLLISFIAAFFLSKFSHLKYTTILFLLVFIVVLIFFNGKSSFDINNYKLLPMSFNGVSIVHELALYSTGGHYFQGNTLFIVLTLLIALSLFLIKTGIIMMMAESYNNVSYREKVIAIAFVNFYFISLFIYTFMLDGFQDRIKIGFVACFLFAINLLRFEYKSQRYRYVIVFSFALSIFVMVRNLKWIY